MGKGINIQASGFGAGIKIIPINEFKKRKPKRKTNLEGRLTYIEIKELEKEWSLLNKGGEVK